MTDGGRYPSVVLMCILLTLGVSYAIPAVLYDNGGSISGWVRDNLPSLADRMRVLEAAQFLQMCDLEQCIASMEYTSADIAWILRETHLAETTLERIVEGTPAYRMLRDADVKQDGIQQKEAIVEEIRTLLITGYGDIDLVNNGCFDRNFNVLHWATFRNRPEVVELLLSIPGVVVTDWPKPNGHGFVSPLQHAELHGFTRLVELLLRFPDIAVDAGAGTPWGTTLHLAAGKFSHEDGSDGTRIVELLIGHGANVSALDARGSTPLHAAAEFGRTDIVEVLLDNGADINHQDSRDGRTPLHEAVAWGQEACVDMLIRNDMVDTSVVDLDATTPN
ncbi:Ankyrin repeat domain-containing protein [Plasmodiophora brassicae]|uniref:Uncharacterized protein n=1 Tax=Plasmodiophora brassicae TaxID=37360 RepID=A0A0G4J0Y1_PLABS|nr:hypothetical protein PBRA_008454 [Plasmodiophora brassicae]